MGDLINRRSRTSTSPVENLKQHGFTGTKGIDETAPALQPDTVLHSKNLNVDFDGGLILRKPIVCVKNIPTVDSAVDVCYAGYMYDKNYILVVRKDATGRQYFGIFKDTIPAKIRIKWSSWVDYTVHSITPDSSSAGFYTLPYIDLSTVHIANTPTSTVCTQCTVNLMATDPFRRADATYLSDTSTDLFYSELYDVADSSNPTMYRPRTLIIYKSLESDVDFDINIVTPDITTISTAQDLAIDANLDLDNPYAIRDVYNTAAPTVKSIIPYVPTRSENGRTEFYPDAVSITVVADPVCETKTLSSIPENNAFSDTAHISENITIVPLEGTSRWIADLHTNVTQPFDPIYVCRNFCKDFKLKLAVNMWLAIHSVGNTSDLTYVLVRIGTYNAHATSYRVEGSELNANIASFSGTESFYGVLSVDAQFNFSIPEIQNVQSPNQNLITRLKDAQNNSNQTMLSDFYTQFANKNYADTEVSELGKYNMSDLNITVLASSPSDKTAYPVYTDVQFEFMYPVKSNGAYRYTDASYTRKIYTQGVG